MLNKLFLGDCLDVLPTLPDNSVDSIVNELSKTYMVYNDGRVINIKRNKEISFNLDHKGYPKARLWCPLLSKNKDKRIPIRLHKVIAMFFLENYNPSLQVNHKNGIKTDNRIENLEMMTNSQNVWHAWNVLDSSQRRLKLIKNNYARKK